jgi:hypothetical protein
MVESQNGVFDEVQPMLTSLLDGYVSNYKDKDYNNNVSFMFIYQNIKNYCTSQYCV